MPALRTDLDAYMRRPDASAEGFVGWITSELLHRFPRGGPEARAQLGTVWSFFENEYGHDEDIDNVIAVSFVESLPYPGEPGVGIIDHLGPKLRAELTAQRQPRGQ